jgi:hypothetical protein
LSSLSLLGIERTAWRNKREIQVISAESEPREIWAEFLEGILQIEEDRKKNLQHF